MSVFSEIKEAINYVAEQRKKMNLREKEKEAYVIGKLYESLFFATMNDIEHLNTFLQDNDKPVIKALKMVYRGVLPFHSAVTSNLSHLKEEFEADFDARNPVPKSEAKPKPQVKVEIQPHDAVKSYSEEDYNYRKTEEEWRW